MLDSVGIRLLVNVTLLVNRIGSVDHRSRHSEDNAENLQPRAFVEYFGLLGSLRVLVMSTAGKVPDAWDDDWVEKADACSSVFPLKAIN